MKSNQLKKMISLVLSVLLLLSAAACAPQNDTTAPTTTAGTQSTAPASTSSTGLPGTDDIVEPITLRKTYMGLWMAKDKDGKIHTVGGTISLTGTVNKGGFSGSIEVLRAGKTIFRSKEVTSEDSADGFLLYAPLNKGTKPVDLCTVFPLDANWNGIILRFLEEDIYQDGGLSYFAFCYGVLNGDAMLERLEGYPAFKDYFE